MQRWERRMQLATLPGASQVMWWRLPTGEVAASVQYGQTPAYLVHVNGTQVGVIVRGIAAGWWYCDDCLVQSRSRYALVGHVRRVHGAWLLNAGLRAWVRWWHWSYMGAHDSRVIPRRWGVRRFGSVGSGKETTR